MAERLYGFMEALCAHGLPLWTARAALRLVNALSRYKTYLPIIWLDTHPATAELAPEQIGTSVAPKINGESMAKQVVLPPVRLYALNDVTVGTRSSAIVSRNGVIIERVEGVAEDRCWFAEGQLIHHGRHLASIAKERKVTALETGFYLAGNGYWNYYHWMIEILPKLRYWKELAAELRAYPLLVGEQTLEYPSLMEALAVFSDAAEVRVLSNDELYSVDRLLYINTPSPSPFNLRPGERDVVTDFPIRPEAIEDWRYRVGLDQRARGGRRLFLARGEERRLYNQAEVLARFVGHGFEAIYPERMTLQEQIDAMSSAELLAGPSGAAWTNLIFCRPGAKALSWIPDESDEFSSFSTIANIVGVDLRYLTYQTGAKSSDELYEANYRLDLADVEQALATLLIDTEEVR